MLKEFIGRLRVANDVNTLDRVDLETKYLHDEEAYNEFLRNFAIFYDRNLLYQLRIAEENDKIKKLISKGNIQYPNSDNDTYYEKIIGGMTHVEDKFKVQYGGKDIGEAMCLLRDGLGIQYYDENSFDYRRTSQILLDAGEKYAECEDDCISDFLPVVYYTATRKDFKKEELAELVEQYKEDHPKLELCNDQNFLFFVNYMTYHNRDVIDGRFYEDVEDIIKASEVLQHMGMGKTKGMNEKYLKLARYTLGEAAKFKKRKEAKDKERLAKVKKAFRNKK